MEFDEWNNDCFSLKNTLLKVFYSLQIYPTLDDGTLRLEPRFGDSESPLLRNHLLSVGLAIVASFQFAVARGGLSRRVILACTICLRWPGCSYFRALTLLVGMFCETFSYARNHLPCGSFLRRKFLEEAGWHRLRCKPRQNLFGNSLMLWCSR